MTRNFSRLKKFSLLAGGLVVLALIYPAKQAFVEYRRCSVVEDAFRNCKIGGSYNECRSALVDIGFDALLVSPEIESTIGDSQAVGCHYCRSIVVLETKHGKITHSKLMRRQFTFGLD